MGVRHMGESEEAKQEWNALITWWVGVLVDGIITEGFSSIRANLMLGLQPYTTHIKKWNKG